jgi:hypothetical protein
MKFKEQATNITRAEIGFLAHAQDITGCTMDEALNALGEFKEQGLIELRADCGTFAYSGALTDVGAIRDRMRIAN